MERYRHADDREGAGVGQREHGADDAAMVELARRDPGAGWAAIWDAHGTALHGYCRRLLDDPSDADDVVADVFLVASQRIDQLRDPEALRAWLFAISRRSVQRRWRARSRTVPVDPQGATVMNRTTGTTVDEMSSVGADDASELLEAAAAGLSVDDRDLLGLTLGADLDTSEVARITGQKQSAVSVRVTRLKETVARAAGALLVARHHRRDCDVLDEVLAAWDGTFDPLWRKRIARHVDGCDTCDDRRRVAVAAFASPLLFAPAPSGLRERVLESISAGRPAGGADGAESPVDDGSWAFAADGFPEPRPWTTKVRGPAAVLAVAAGLVLVVVVGVVLWGGGDDAAVVAVADVATTTTSTSIPSATTTTPDPDDTTLSAPVDPPGDRAPEPSPTIATPPTAPQPPPPPPTAPAPTVSITVDPDALTTCGTSTRATTATVVVGAGAGDETTTVSWEGGAPGSVDVAGPGTHEVVVPLERDPAGPISQTVVVSATTVDADGVSVVDTHDVTIDVVPC